MLSLFPMTFLFEAIRGERIVDARQVLSFRPFFPEGTVDQYQRSLERRSVRPRDSWMPASSKLCRGAQIHAASELLPDFSMVLSQDLLGCVPDPKALCDFTGQM